jgi:hypothetical protein
MIIKHFDTMGSIVRNVDLLASIRAHICRIRAANPIGKLQILGTIELVEHIAVQVEYDHTHYLALDHNDTRLVVDVDAAWMLQYIRAEFPYKLSKLIVDLNLMRWRSLRHHNVARLLHNAHTIRIEQLTIAFTALAKLKLKIAILVEYLYAMRIRVGHNYIVVRVYGHSTRLRELTIVDAEFAKLAVIDHFRSI